MNTINYFKDNYPLLDVSSRSAPLPGADLTYEIDGGEWMTIFADSDQQKSELEKFIIDHQHDMVFTRVGVVGTKKSKMNWYAHTHVEK